MDKDAYYFPHFCNARHDRKVHRLRKELGVEGYGIFFMLLEVLRDQIDFKYPVQDIDLLAEEFGTSEQKVRTVVCNYQLFEVDIEEQFFSPKLVLYLQPYLKMKEQRKLAGMRSAEARRQKLLPKPSTDDEQSSNDRSTTVQQSKVKESKVKESKVNKIKYAEYVYLTVEEHQRLVDKHGESNTNRLIEILDNYKGSSGKKYESDYRAILNWAVDRLQQEKQAQPNVDRFKNMKT